MTNALQISEASNMGIHALVLLHKVSRKQRLSVAQIAEVLAVSRSHLAKVMQKLVRGGLVESVRGARGGFVLKKPASRISLWQIVKAIDGEPRVTGCLFAHSRCTEGACVVSAVQHEVSSLVVARLKELKVSDFDVTFKDIDRL